MTNTSPIAFNNKPSKGYPMYVDTINLVVDIPELKTKYLKNKKRS